LILMVVVSYQAVEGSLFKFLSNRFNTDSPTSKQIVKKTRVILFFSSTLKDFIRGYSTVGKELFFIVKGIEYKTLIILSLGEKLFKYWDHANIIIFE
jgi:hypothetical protein